MTETLREVRLYGVLGRQFGRTFRLAVATPAEAAQALCAVLPGFKARFLGADGRAAYHVYVGRRGQRRAITEERVTELAGADDPICIVPAIAGAKRAGLGQIILGVALIGLALWNPLGLFSGQFAAFSGVAGVGTAMVVSGVVQMLSPQRKAQKAVENQPSYGMDAGALQTVQQGVPVPIAYGRVICGSAQISAGLSTDEYYPIYGDGGGVPSQAIPSWMDRDAVDLGIVYQV